jgi:hypothetical protein
VGHFFLGLAMMVGGGYLFLQNIRVSHHWSWSSGFQMGGISVTSGYLLFPLIFGIGLIFYNAKNLLGWVLTAASAIMFFVGIIASINFRFGAMSAFDLGMILVLLIGGLGLFLRSLKSFGGE